ncbi:MAG: CsgG/HfaB family protein [Opitutales bacterium]
MKRTLLLLTISFGLAFAGCSSTRTIEKTGDPANSVVGGVKARTPLPMDMRIKVAVLDFEDRTAYGKGRLGKSASNILVTFLSRSGQFALYEREKLDKLVGEQGINTSESVDVSEAATIGKLVGVDYVFIGAVSNYGYRSTRSQVLIFGDKIIQQAEATVDVRMVEVATGRIIASESGTGLVTVESGHVLGVGTSAGYDETTAANALRAAISQYVDTLIDQGLANR